ncbi:hypothetical protein HDU97_001576 [Phlyctochytrium planicorne]|nr:hypothetical protein HDU97_001576 [Phlyctochytrium planicorne]
MSDDEREHRGPHIEDLDMDTGPVKRPSNYDEHGEEVFLDTKKLKTSVWLVKIPEFVMREWEKFDKPGEELGRLSVYPMSQTSGPANKKQKVTLHLPKDAPWTEKIPHDYILDLLPSGPSQQNTFVFTEDSEGRARAVSGRVVHEATMRPFQDARYREVMKMRRVEAENKKKNIAFMELKDGKKVMQVGSSNVSTMGNAAGEFNLSQKRTTLDKRERLPKEELINQIFAVYKENEYYYFKELVERLKQPQAYLKEVVNEVCDLVKKGEEHGKYALKADYRNIGAGAIGGSSSGVKVEDLDDLDDDDDLDED